MKKLVALSLVAAVAGIVPASARAAGSHPMSGCGLGYVLFANQENSKLYQILGATTNGTSGNQTFGITSGTSGCTEDGAVKFVKEAEVFADVNLESLRKEMAQGQGEFVNAFAVLVGGESKAPELVQLFQKEYGTLFPSAATSSSDMLKSLSAVLEANPVLG